MKKIMYVGLDVHAETSAVAVAECGRDGEVRSLGTIANRWEAVRKAICAPAKKPDPPATLSTGRSRSSTWDVR